MAARPGYRAAAGTDFTCANLSPVSFHGPIMHEYGCIPTWSSSIPCSRPCFYQSSGSRISSPHPQKSPVIKRNIMTTYLDENISGFIFLLNNWLTTQLPDAIICVLSYLCLTVSVEREIKKGRDLRIRVLKFLNCNSLGFSKNPKLPNLIGFSWWHSSWCTFLHLVPKSHAFVVLGVPQKFKLVLLCALL